MLCLTHPTDPRWAARALADLDVVLADHAHCEMKAAANAISLATRWPASAKVARALTAVAEEELRHFREVLAVLEARGVSLGRPETDAYAADLRRAAQAGAEKTPTAPSPTDSSSARSSRPAPASASACSPTPSPPAATWSMTGVPGTSARLVTMGETPKPQARPLAAFYDELFACEARHYTTLVDLAIEVSGDAPRVRERLAELARTEGEIAARCGARPTMHG